MMTFVNMDARGLVILPTHRVVHGVTSFDRGKFIERARKYFEVVPLTGSCEQKMTRLHEAGQHGTSLLAQGTATGKAGAPDIPDNNIRPFFFAPPGST